MSQNTRVLNFSDLSEEEKSQYIRFMIENNINFQEDDQDDQYIAKVKIRNNTRGQLVKPKPVQKENALKRGPRSTSISNSAAMPIHNNSSFMKHREKAPIPKPVKSSNKDPFVLASNQNMKKNVAVNKIDTDYVSFRNTQEDTIQFGETQGEQSVYQVADYIGLRNDTSPVDRSKDFQQASLYKSGENMNRSRSVNQVEKKLNFDEGASFITYDKSPIKKASIIDEYVVNCIEQYKTFSELTNLAEIGAQSRPKKLSPDHLSNQIEEIFSTRFIRETAALKANMNKAGNVPKTFDARSNSFPHFVYGFLKEKNKMTKAFEQAALALAYSTMLTKRKSYEAEIFSKFLSEEFDSEDLTFFLFVRSIVEKELVVMLANKTSSAVGILLTQKNCLKVLESVYGKEEKALVNRVFKKVKNQIEWEKEKKLDLGTGKIYLYSFLKITLEDYHLTRKNFLSTLEASFDDQSKYDILNTKETEASFVNMQNRPLDLERETKKAAMDEYEYEEEERHKAEKDELDQYLFDDQKKSINSDGGLKKALHDITNQGTQNITAASSGMLSNIHNHWYNNPNTQHRNSMTEQSQEDVALFGAPANATLGTHSSNQSLISFNVYGDNMAKQDTPSLSQNLTRSNSTLSNSDNNMMKDLPRKSSHQNLQSVPSLGGGSYASSSTSGNRNSYSNIHRRSSGGVNALPNNNTQSSANLRVPSTSDLSSGFNSNANINSQANFQNLSNIPTDITNTKGEFDSFSPLERTNTKEIEVPLLRDALPTVDYTSMEKSTADHFSFRNWESQKQETPYESTQLNKTNEPLQTQSQEDMAFGMNRSFNKSLSKDENTSQINKLQEYTLIFMMKKVHEFIETMLFEGQEQRSAEEEKVKVGLLDLFERKFRSLLKALFSFDKLKWLNSLMVEDPTTKQLQNIEDLQRDLRGLQKRAFDDLNEEDIETFAHKIFRTPELSTQIGRLIVEFTLPQDLLYSNDTTECNLIKQFFRDEM